MEKYKKSYKNNKFTISSTTWCKNFDLLHGSYLVSDIQDYFEYVITKLETVTDNSSTKIYVNKIEDRITFEIKTGHYTKLWTFDMVKLLRSTEKKIHKNKNGENVPHLEITEVVLIHCNVVCNYYQCDSKVFYTFVTNKSFAQFLDISPKNLAYRSF